MSAQIRRYIREKEDWQFKRGYTPEEMKASKLRKDFLNRYIINFDTHLYKTQEERDWSYLAKRQAIQYEESTTTMSSSRESVTHSSWPTFSSHGVSTSTREWSFGLFSLSLSVTPSSAQCTLHPIQPPPETQQKNLRHVQHWRGLPFGMQEE